MASSEVNPTWHRCGRKAWWQGTRMPLGNVQSRQCVDYAVGFEAYGDHAQEEVEGVAWVVHGFDGPGVGVVDYAGVFVGFEALAFHHPVEGGFAVDHVVVGGERNVAHGDVVIIQQGAFVVYGFAVEFLLAIAHFFNPIESCRIGGGASGNHNASCIGWDAFVAYVEFGEFAAGLAEGPEVGCLFHTGNTGQFFAQVVGVAFTVIRTVQ